MSDISKKSIGYLIDELITTDMKCWFSQEDIMNESLSTEKRLQAAIRAQQMNDRRNQLIAAIDNELGQGHLSPTSKSYHTYFENNE